MKKLIKFVPVTKEAELASTEPQSSIKFLPDWYKQIPPFMNGDKKLKFPINLGTHNSTVKKCVPFLDGMTAGYMVVLDDDVYVEQVDNQPWMRWKSDVEMITWHFPEQHPNLPIPEDYHPLVSKWHNDFAISTPKEFSAIFMHPINRLDLPFFTLSGIVDSDKYPNPIHFPFLLKKGFEGIIEAGTPVAQIIPIKRELWKSQKEKFNPNEQYQNKRKFLKTFADSYKKNFWVRKSYD